MIEWLPLRMVWPPTVARTQPRDRRNGPYRAAFTQTAKELEEDLARWRVPGPVQIGTDLLVGPRGGVRGPARDPGVAARITKGGATLVLALDRYVSPDHNLRGIYLAVDGLRRLERDGTDQLFDQMMKGFQALPPPPPQGPECWTTLNLKPGASREEILAAYRRRAKEFHPDRGGDNHAFMRLKEARDRALGFADA